MEMLPFTLDTIRTIGLSGVVLTASSRQSAYLMGYLCEDAGVPVLAAPAIFPLEQWLSDWTVSAALRDDLPPELQEFELASPVQARWLWESAVRDDGERLGLLNAGGIADLLQEADTLVSDWALQVPDALATEEYRQFRQWQRQVYAAARKHRLLLPSQWRARVIDALGASRSALPPEFLLLGFEDFTREQQRLIDALRTRGVTVRLMALPQVDRPAVARTPALDPQAELRLAARWAREQITQGKTRVAVVVPGLSPLRDDVEAIFTEVLHPEARARATPLRRRLFNISLGQPLTRHPLVQDALTLLDIALSPQPGEFPRLSALLRSPYWSAGTREADARAQLDAEAREQLAALCRFSDLARALGHSRSIAAKRLFRLPEHLEAFKKLKPETWRKPSAPSTWSERFARALEALGWPGDRALDSIEHQYLLRFRRALEELSSLDTVAPRISQGEALRELARLCRSEVFQPQTVGTPPVQVLGVIEAAGGRFDALWVTGMTDDAWPAPCRPNPFLPASVLREAGVPRASNAQELRFASRATARLAHSAPQVIFSYASQDSERELAPSPLIEGFAQWEVPTALLESAALVPASLEALDDLRGPPVRDDEIISGGTGLLKAQAICPLWAFVQYRLHAKALRVPASGLEATDRGTLVHAALEAFWSKHRSYKKLIELNTRGELDAAVAEAVATALADLQQELGAKASPRLIELEQERLTLLVAQWLRAAELEREDFEVVSLEEPLEVALKGLRIRMVADRIDRLTARDACLVLDYKTGASLDTQNWATARLTEPQLPLYAVHTHRSRVVAGVAFAKVRQKGAAFVGITDEDGILPRVSPLAGSKLFSLDDFPDWDAVLAHWEQALDAIAQEIMDGEAALRFVDSRKLEYCEVKPVLRLGACDEDTKEESA